MDIIAKARVYRAIIEKAMATADEQLIAKAPTLVKHWVVDENVVPGDIRYDKLTEKAYKVRENMGHTTQENWEPSKTPAMWEVIDLVHEGIKDDPIEAVAGMKYYYNKYYIENNILYRCIREDAVDGVVLQYTPSQLIGIYFEVVNQ